MKNVMMTLREPTINAITHTYKTKHRLEFERQLKIFLDLYRIIFEKMFQILHALFGLRLVTG